MESRITTRHDSVEVGIHLVGLAFAQQLSWSGATESL